MSSLVQGYYRGGRMSLRKEEREVEQVTRERERSRSRSLDRQDRAAIEKLLAFHPPAGTRRPSAQSPAVEYVGYENTVQLELPRDRPHSPRTSFSPMEKARTSSGSTTIGNYDRSSRNSFSSNGGGFYETEPASPAWRLGMSPRIGSLPPLPPLMGGGSPRHSHSHDPGSPRLSSGRPSPRSSPRASVGPPGGAGGSLARTSSGPIDPPPPPVSAEMRALMRNKLLDVLENPNEDIEKRWTEFIDDIITLGADSEAIYDLYQVPITRRILERTSIGRVLQSAKWAKMSGAHRLVQVWKNEIKRKAAHALAIEHGVFARYHPRDASDAASPAKNANWKYTHDVREILSVLRKDWNAQVRRGLNNGSIWPDRFLDDFYKQPEKFESPKLSSMRKTSKEEQERIDRQELEYPMFDQNIVCDSCRSSGAYYKILALDEDNFSRQCKCKGCGGAWKLDG